MNRIICDICGSEYPENAERCPICSYPRQGNEKIAAATSGVVRDKVKGGKFSSKNVKKRRKAQEKAARGTEENPNKPLWITVILLLIAIALVTAYIAARFLGGRDAFTGSAGPQTTASAATQAPSTQQPTVPCESLVLNVAVMDLEVLGEQKQLSVMAVPGNTTDAVLYASADPAVAAVSGTGLVTAMGPGQTTVTVSCGTVVETVTVVCWFPAETTAPAQTTAPTEPPETARATEPPVETAPAELMLDVVDASFFSPDEAFTLSAKFGGKSVSRSKITWSTSDPAVATVENGVVTAVGKGTATVTAEYEGKTARCIVRCRFKDTTWQASASDVTLAVGESFTLSVTNSSGEVADAIWTVSMEGIVSISGRTITAHIPGTVTLSSTVDGVAMTCIVRVK